jgi:3-oxoacyl-[acyl-carrier-protein] synthase II
LSQSKALPSLIRDSIVPPTINTTEIEPDYKDKYDFPLAKGKSKEITYAMSNTFGFGGHIATVIFKKI